MSHDLVLNITTTDPNQCVELDSFQRLAVPAELFVHGSWKNDEAG